MSELTRVFSFNPDTDLLAYYLEPRHLVVQKVLPALHWLHMGLVKQHWSNVADPATLVDHVIDEFDLCLVRDTLICYSVNQPWFTTDLWISEEFVAPVGGNRASMEEVVQAFTKIGRSLGCVTLSIGTRANPRQKGLAHLLEKTGARISTIELIKDITP